MSTEGTTLERELREAMEAALHAAQNTPSAAYEADLYGLHARLRARAERMRELRATMRDQPCGGECYHSNCFLWRALTGPLGTPGDTEETPR